MTHFDVFNGDADGICSLQQLRLAEPVDSVLISGVKRDIALLDRVQAGEGDEVTVLDISLDKNSNALNRLLEAGARIHYFDHHHAGEIPVHPRLHASIDPTPDRGTSLLVDDFLAGRYRAWAVVGTFGDNFDHTARQAAQPIELDEPELELLRDLGIFLNYNGYGASIEDLNLPPTELYRRLQPFADPLDFIRDDDTFIRLREGYLEDMARATAVQPSVATDRHGVFLLPAESWARRVGGVFANRLAQDNPNRAHALLTRLPEGGFLVSVRAPLETKVGADKLCLQFSTGGGRPAAAGINQLPEELYDRFIETFIQAF